MNDYKKALESVKNIPKIYLGQEVMTTIGKGIVVNMKMEHNGLYIRPEVSTVTVWFSCADSTNGWVNKEFRLSEIKVNYRKLKLEKIKKLNE